MKTLILNGTIEGEGEDLVLLHPVGLDHTFWGALASLVGKRVLSLDLRGHGESGAPDERPPIEVYAEDVHATMRHHGMERAAVLGLSFGGMVAQTLALSYPGAVSRLIVCACPGGLPPEAHAMIRERGLAAERRGMAAVVETTLERWFTPAFMDDPRVERVRQRLLSDDPKLWSDGWHAIAGFWALPRLGSITVPTMVIAGEHDKATSREASTTLAAAIPGASLSILPGAPHMMQIENNPAFVEAVAEFLA
ncbi:alpha/beta fold hydrolase [Rhizobium lusitanum]|uniref:Alpha/beta fold hydrolase n=1 Tax=Rhizobium lusitanum TaxID=293958 RepID=A0A6L9U912_9HYPH|nr:alpha/beta fold hydrolase [Rhizobium lusitanum]NEI72445.1 alpha/beta fold hydrolase [Rhizobium lusitanum]